MPFLPAFLLMAQAGLGSRTEIVLHHRRPSAVLAGIKGSFGASLVAYDDRGAVGVSGTPKQIENAREYLRLIDVPRQRLLIRVTVTSPVDHLTWEVDVRLTSGQKWRTADEETGTEITLEPRVDANGSLNVSLLARCRGAEMTSMLRLPKGGSRSLDMGDNRVQDVEIDPKGTVKVSEGKVALPTITVRYVGG